uniref:Zinc finger, CCHC-type n=1 Tax=Tanacetum cinerariifolium TaxID=118510 RepID=A0A699H1G9_TANCI|nr:zinc finger, CCHC-type [Tanacetum cinerariifolium]
MQDMSKDGLIPAIDMDTEKCKTYMLTKITKKPFQNVKRVTNVLELIHSDLCDLHATPSLGNKKYFVTFIDDAFRAAVRLPDPKLKTLGERGIECIFVGYAEHSKAFRFYVTEPNDSVTINTIIELKDAIFDKQRLQTSGLQIDLQKKLNVDGTIEKFTAKLVIQGFKQKSGIDYFDTYAPVARISTIRLLIVMASIHNLTIYQMDVKTAFLNRELEEEVYMNQPLGFIMPGNKNKMCKLIKSLYGLKLAPKQWHQKFDEVVLSNGYLLNQADKCVYRKFDASEFLSSMFYMKDMGEADIILGIRIKHESNDIAISQSHYIKKVLKKFNYSDCAPVSTPLDTCEKLIPNRGLTVSQLEYSSVIGCLMYAMTCTRPDITFAVGKLSRYTGNLGTQHWQVIQRVLKYLKKTIDYILVYSSYPISVGSTGKDAEWLKNLLFEIPLWVKPMAPISIRCDSAATLANAYSQMYNRKSRHLGVRHSMIRELITNGVVSIEFVRSQQNLADHLTKVSSLTEWYSSVVAGDIHQMIEGFSFVTLKPNPFGSSSQPNVGGSSSQPNVSVSESFREEQAPVEEIEEIQVSTPKKKSNRRHQTAPKKKPRDEECEDQHCYPWSSEEETAFKEVPQFMLKREELKNKRYKLSGSSSFNTRESGEGCINLNTTVGDEEDEVEEVRRPRPIG